MAKPTRTFAANTGQYSRGTRGPDQIELDLDVLFKMLDPASTISEGVSGGIGAENIKDGAITNAKIGNCEVDQSIVTETANTGNLMQVLSWIVKEILELKGSGATNWYDTPRIDITTIKTLFDIASGHDHSGDTNDGVKIPTAGIADGAVTEGKVGTGAVTEGKIGTGAVTEGKIADGAVTDAKIGNRTLYASPAELGQEYPIKTDTLINLLQDVADNVANIKGGVNYNNTSFHYSLSDLSHKFVDETLAHRHRGASSSDGAPIQTDGLADGAVTTIKITDGNVTTAKIADSNVTTAKIADGNVTEAKLGTGSVTGTKLGAGSVTSAKIVDGAVTEAELGAGAVTSAKIVDGAVIASKLGTGSVTETKLGNGAVTLAKLATDTVAALGAKAPQSTTYTKTEVDNAIVAAKNAVINQIDRKESVATVTDLSTTYPDAEIGWVCTVRDTMQTYVFDGNDWGVASETVPYADDNTDGILRFDDYNLIQALKDVNVSGGASASTDTFDTIVLALQAIAYMLRSVIGQDSWRSTPTLNLQNISERFENNTYNGHKHTGAAGQGPQIGTTGIAFNAITTERIALGAVTAEALSTNSVSTAKIFNNAVTTAKIADGNVTWAKLDATTASAINAKATQASVDSLTTTVGTKASQTSVDNLESLVYEEPTTVDFTWNPDGSISIITETYPDRVERLQVTEYTNGFITRALETTWKEGTYVYLERYYNYNQVVSDSGTIELRLASITTREVA